MIASGLHEDLNRVKKKEFVAAVESKGRVDHVVAMEVATREAQGDREAVRDGEDLKLVSD